MHTRTEFQTEQTSDARIEMRKFIFAFSSLCILLVHIRCYSMLFNALNQTFKFKFFQNIFVYLSAFLWSINTAANDWPCNHHRNRPDCPSTLFSATPLFARSFRELLFTECTQCTYRAYIERLYNRLEFQLERRKRKLISSLVWSVV